MRISKLFSEFHLIDVSPGAAALNKIPQGSLWLDVQAARFRDVALVCGENFCLSALKSDKVCRYQPVSASLCGTAELMATLWEMLSRHRRLICLNLPKKQVDVLPSMRAVQINISNSVFHIKEEAKWNSSSSQWSNHVGRSRIAHQYCVASSCSHNMILIPEWTDGAIRMSCSTLRDQATILHFTATVS